MFDSTENEVIEILDTEVNYSLFALYQPLEILKSLEISSGDECSFWNLYISEKKIDPKDFSSLSSCNNLSDIKKSLQGIMPLEIGDEIQFNRKMGSYDYEYRKSLNSTYGDELFIIEDWEYFSEELWVVENINFNDVEVRRLITFKVNIKNSEENVKNIDTTYTINTIDKETYLVELIFDYKNQIIEFDYDEKQIRSGYYFTRKPNTIDIKVKYDYKKMDSAPLSSLYTTLNSGFFQFSPFSTDFSVTRYVPRTSDHTEWWFELIQK